MKSPSEIGEVNGALGVLVGTGTEAPAVGPGGDDEGLDGPAAVAGALVLVGAKGAKVPLVGSMTGELVESGGDPELLDGSEAGSTVGAGSDPELLDGSSAGSTAGAGSDPELLEGSALSGGKVDTGDTTGDSDGLLVRFTVTGAEKS